MKKECINCHITLEEDEINLKYNNVCPMCNTVNSFVAEYIMDIKRISSDETFIQAMIKLHDENPIEYQLKLNQFKTQIQEQKAFEEKQQESKKPHCPTCGSTNIGRLVGFAQDGDLILGGTRRFFYCNNCGYEW